MNHDIVNIFILLRKPTTLFVIFSRIGGMASALSIVVLLLRQYNQNNLNDTQPGIDFNELQRLIHDQSSRRKMEIVTDCNDTSLECTEFPKTILSRYAISC